MQSDLFDEACGAYWQRCEAEGHRLIEQPSRWRSRIGWKYVHLENVHGLMARYVIKTRQIMFRDEFRQ